MSFEKKPSSTRDRGKVRSAEELETYGVWVKSGPQDIASDEPDAVPFDMGFAGMGPASGAEGPDAAFGPFDGGFAGGGFVAADGFVDGGFVPGGGAASGAAQEEMSAQLLLRIADELSSIRSDIDGLKKEFAEMRGEAADGGPGGDWGRGFFSGEDDGKIALTVNEMDSIMTSSGLSLDDDDGFDALRDADAEALKELSRQKEAADEGAYGYDEGIGDEPGFAAEAGGWEEDADDVQGRFPEPDDGVFGADSEGGEGGLDVGENDIFRAFADDLAPPDALEDMDELRDLRMHGADPLTPAPDDTSFIEEDPLAGTHLETGESFGSDGDADGFDFGAFDVGENPLDAMRSLDDGDPAPEDLPPSFDDDASPDGDEPADEDPFAFGDAEGASSAEDEAFPPLDDDDGFPIEADDESPFGEGFPETHHVGLSLEDEELSLEDDEDGLADDEDGPLMSDDLAFGGGLTMDEEMFLEDGPESPEDGLSLDDEDDLPPGEDGEVFGDALSLGGALSLGEGPDGDPAADGETPADGGDGDEVVLPSWLISEEPEENAGEPVLEDSPLPDEGPVLADEPMDEGPFDDPLLDDISLDLGDFGEDSNIVRDIPEGFKTDDDETLVSFDDDLEAIAEEEEEAPKPKEKAAGKPRKSKSKAAAKTAAAGGDIDISPDLKSDLKDVLAYMDQLLESLPEDKIEEFAKSEHFDTYKKLFKELGLV